MLAEGWSHERAQEYELSSSENWMRENAAVLSARIVDARKTGERWAGPENRIIHEFFEGDAAKWAEFAERISTRTCLEIGPGPCGGLAIWWWAGRKVVVDPLIDRYRELAERYCSETWWTPDITYCPRCAEERIPDFEHAVDGAIICRNALDHCAEPTAVIENIASYAAPDCALLLWSDLWHNAGEDEGHRNITRDRDAFAEELRTAGFDLEYVFSGMRPNGQTLGFGCRARRR